MAVELHLHDIRKTFVKDGASFNAVERVELDVKGGELVTFLGPSGCGKTTTLRMVAGFETPTAGRILIDGQDVTNVMVNKREIGFVFQNYALFPHMTIGDNVGYGLKMRSESGPDVTRKVAEALEMVENELAAAKVADSVVVGINLANHTSVTEGAFRRRNWQDFSRAMGYLVKKWKEFPAFAGVAIGPFLRLELIQEEE